MSFMEEKNF